MTAAVERRLDRLEARLSPSDLDVGQMREALLAEAERRAAAARMISTVEGVTRRGDLAEIREVWGQLRQAGAVAAMKARRAVARMARKERGLMVEKSSIPAEIGDAERLIATPNSDLEAIGAKVATLAAAGKDPQSPFKHDLKCETLLEQTTRIGAEHLPLSRMVDQNGKVAGQYLGIAARSEISRLVVKNHFAVATDIRGDRG